MSIKPYEDVNKREVKFDYCNNQYNVWPTFSAIDFKDVFKPKEVNAKDLCRVE